MSFLQTFLENFPPYEPGKVDHRPNVQPPAIVYTEQHGWTVWWPCISCFQMCITPVDANLAILVQTGIVRTSPLCRGCTN